MALGTHFSLAVNATARKEEQGGMGTAPQAPTELHHGVETHGGHPKNGHSKLVVDERETGLWLWGLF